MAEQKTKEEIREDDLNVAAYIVEKGQNFEKVEDRLAAIKNLQYKYGDRRFIVLTGRIDGLKCFYIYEKTKEGYILESVEIHHNVF